MRVAVRRIARSACTIVVLGLLPTSAAHADETIYAGPVDQFLNGDVTIDQGEKVTFTNLDAAGHDVTARTRGPGGQPLFGSALTGTGSSSSVVGTEYLTTGSYEFFCSIHPNMIGTLSVTSAGTPAQRPGPGSGPAPAAAAARDTTPPSLKLRVLDSSLSAVRRHRALAVGVTTDEPATVRLTARAGKTALASSTARLTGAGTQRVSLRLTSAGLRRVRAARRLTLSVTAAAVDSASNVGTSRAKAALRR